MSDNVSVTEGSGKTIASDDIAGVQHQRIKLTLGADGVNDGDVASGNPLPIGDAGGSLTVDDGGGSITVDGTFFQATQPISAVSLPLPSGAATSALQTSSEALLTTIDADTGNIATSVAGLLTDTQLRASAVPVSTASLPLPTGAASETTLSALNTKIPASLTVTSTRLLVDPSGVTSPVSIATAPALVASTASIGKVVPEGSASGVGLTMDRQTALSNTAVAVKASSGRVYGWHIYNPNSTDVFLHFYDVAQGSVVVGTTVPNLSLYLPPLGGIDDLAAAIPIAFATAITIAASTTITGGTAASSGVLVNTWYV